jgi:hypothetical protein
MKMKSLASRFVGIGGLAAFLALGTGVAQANIVTTLTGAVNVAGGSQWTYDVTIDALQTGSNPPGAFFTLYDFGLQTLFGTTGSLTTAWIYSMQAFSTPASLVTPTDTALLNAHFDLGVGFSIPGPMDLGTFTLFSPFSAPGVPCNPAVCRVVNFDGQATLGASGLPQGNIGFTFAPVPGPILGAGLPGLLAACGGLLALARRRRQKFA